MRGVGWGIEEAGGQRRGKYQYLISATWQNKQSTGLTRSVRCQIVLASRNYQSELTGQREPWIVSESLSLIQAESQTKQPPSPPPPIYQHSFYRNPTSYSILWEPAGGMKGIKYWEGGKNIKSSLITSSLPLQKWSERKFYLGNTSLGISLRVLSGYCTAKHGELPLRD